MARRQRSSALERQWRERLASWASSGLSVRAFCRARGLIETAFYYWKRELRVRDAAGAGASMKSPLRQRPQLKFVPVTVLADRVLPAATLAVEVRCPSGHVVVLSSWDAADLASLFAAIAPQASLAREARPC